MAIGGSLAATFLVMGGYIENQAQTPESLRTILLIFTVFPIFGHVATLIALKWYDIDKDLHKKIIQDIKDRDEELEAENAMSET